MLVGRGGSGTVFFSQCTLRCVFCQNHQISQGGMGAPLDTDALAAVFLDLQHQGAREHQPRHAHPLPLPPSYSPLRDARAHGLTLPLVYNTNAYDSPEALAILDGIVDICLPDMKYTDGANAGRYSGAENYPGVARAAIVEMHRQVGLVRTKDGTAQRGSHRPPSGPSLRPRRQLRLLALDERRGTHSRDG